MEYSEQKKRNPFRLFGERPRDESIFVTKEKERKVQYKQEKITSYAEPSDIPDTYTIQSMPSFSISDTNSVKSVYINSFKLNKHDFPYEKTKNFDSSVKKLEDLKKKLEDLTISCTKRKSIVPRNHPNRYSMIPNKGSPYTNDDTKLLSPRKSGYLIVLVTRKNPYQTLKSMINSECEMFLEKLDGLDMEEIMHIERQISYMKQKNLLAGMIHFPHIEFDDDDNSYEDNHKYFKKIDQNKLKWDKEAEKDKYVKLKATDDSKDYYFKVYDQVELGLATDPYLQDSIIPHGRDIDSNTNNADMKGAIKEVRIDISKCISDYKSGNLYIVNKARGNIKKNHK